LSKPGKPGALGKVAAEYELPERDGLL